VEDALGVLLLQGFRRVPMQKLTIGLVALILSFCLHGQAQNEMVCVAPSLAETPQRCAPGFCASGDLSFKVDRRPVKGWPKTESLKIDDLNAGESHRVVIYRAKKAQQSFTFRFSDFKSPKLCLFLNDLYWTPQLWELKRAPWCKCH